MRAPRVRTWSRAAAAATPARLRRLGHATARQFRRAGGRSWRAVASQRRRAAQMISTIDACCRNATERALLRARVVSQLGRLRDALAQESADARLIVATYNRYRRGQADSAELARANERLRKLLKLIGIGTLGVLPFSFVTIPVVVQLGRRFGVDVLPRDTGPDGARARSRPRA